MIEPGPALLMLAFIVSMLVFVFKLHGMNYHLRTRHPQVWDDDGSPRNLLRWRYWTDHLVFPHRRLRARLEAEEIEDKALDARITSLVRWNRLSIALYAANLVLAALVHW